MQRATGSVARVDRKRGSVVVREVPNAIWAAGSEAARAGVEWPGAPARRLLHQAHSLRTGCVTSSTRLDGSVAPGSAPSGVGFAEAAEEYLRFAEQDRGCKPSTIRGYRSAAQRPSASSLRRDADRGHHRARDRALARRYRRVPNRTARFSRTRRRTTCSSCSTRSSAARSSSTGSHGTRWSTSTGIGCGPAATSRCSRPRRSGASCAPQRRRSTARSSSRPPSPACVAASSSGSAGATSTSMPRPSVSEPAMRLVSSRRPKSGKVRAVPMAPDVAGALARIGQRERFTGEDDFVFVGEGGLPLERRRAQFPLRAGAPGRGAPPLCAFTT